MSDDDSAPLQAPRARRAVTQAKGLVVDTSMCKYNVVRLAADLTGWEEAEDDGRWHMFWTDLSVSSQRVRALLPLQRLNHFAEMTGICHKATAAGILKRMLKVFATEYRFFPASWQLPKEVAAVHRHMAERQAALAGAAAPAAAPARKGKGKKAAGSTTVG